MLQSVRTSLAAVDNILTIMKAKQSITLSTLTGAVLARFQNIQKEVVEFETIIHSTQNCLVCFTNRISMGPQSNHFFSVIEVNPEQATATIGQY